MANGENARSVPQIRIDEWLGELEALAKANPPRVEWTEEIDKVIMVGRSKGLSWFAIQKFLADKGFNRGTSTLKDRHRKLTS